MRFIRVSQDARGRSCQYYGAGRDWVVLRNQVLRSPAIMRRTPNCNRGTASFVVTGREDVEKGVATAQHPSPVLSHLFEMGKKAGSFVGIKKTGALVQRKDFAYGQSIDLDAVGVVDVCQPRKAAQRLLI